MGTHKVRYRKETLEIRPVIEYSIFFEGEEPIDVQETLKSFDRKLLIRMTALLSLHYGNLHFPDEKHTLFSTVSAKYMPYLNDLFIRYKRRIKIKPNQVVQVCTFRSSLELWRQIFSIPSNEFIAQVKDCDVELILFKVILTLNEKLVSFKGNSNEFTTDELLFLNSFLNNDSNNYDFKDVIQTQSLYFKRLVEFIPSNNVLCEASKRLFAEWGITNWAQYYTTILWLAYETNKYKEECDFGVPVLLLDKMKLKDKTGLFSVSLVNSLSIAEDEFIPYDLVENATDRCLNIDYRRFRAKPFVRMNDGSYVVINNQLLCERLFNSLFFDFIPLINGSKGSCGKFDYNKDFIEKELFRKTFLNCFRHEVFTFPSRNYMGAKEEANEPDFYARTKNGELIIAECKAIKMNGECRDAGDYKRLLEELHEKIVVKTRNIDRERKEYKGGRELIGVGQLIRHIESIEDDSFRCDDTIPDQVIYYPILVLEDVRFFQPGFLYLINRWFYEEIVNRTKMNLSEMSLKPVMTFSIRTLYLYDDYIRRNRLPQIINSFLGKYASFNPITGKYSFDNPFVNFDSYLRLNHFDKSREITKWRKEFLVPIEV